MFKAPCLLLLATGAALAQSMSSLDFEFYRTRVEPIFVKDRKPGEGIGASCASCHTRIATRLRLQPMAAGATSWTLEQSRSNFAVVSKLIAPGNADKSPLLIHPLAAEAGGDAAHTGGKFWASKENPEWQTLAAWVRTGPASGAMAAPSVTLDYAFFRDRVQPIFLAKRRGHARCIECHDNRPPRLQELEPGAAGWDEAQSRLNFEAWQRVVVPGDPASSRMLMHPLSHEAGGDPFHAGGKHWKSQNDPEWQTLSAWVRGEKLEVRK